MTESPAVRILEAEILLNVARLPLVSVDALECLADRPTDAVGRALQALERHGWLDIVRPGLSAPDPRLYVLRLAAARAFAEAFQLPEREGELHWPIRRGDILQAITTAEVTVGVNGLLTRVAASWRRSGGTVVDLRALPRSRRDAARWWPAWMEGYCCLERDGEVYRAFVAWDAAGVPDAHRLARVRAWFDALAAVDHWGGDWLPPVLLVCPGREEERAWAQAIAATARRRDTWPLRVAATQPDSTTGDGCIDWYWLDDEAPVSFDEVLVPSRVPPPVPAPRPRFDLIDRGVSRLAPALQDWAARLLTQPGRTASRDRDAALAIALAEPPRRVLRLLARHPYLSAKQLADLLGESQESVGEWLRDLEHYGLIAALEPAEASR